MRHTVKLQNVIIGHSDLEHTDTSLGRAWGVFRPGLGWELVQPIFRLFVDAVPMRGGEPLDKEKLDRYHAGRDRLGLQLTDGDGQVIPANAIHIADYPGHLTLDVLISDESYWEGRQLDQDDRRTGRG